MAKDHSNERPVRSYREKIHKFTFGRLDRSSHYSKDVPSPPLSTTHYSTPTEVKPLKKFVHFSSTNVENNGDVGQNSFCEDEYTSYIDGLKKKMRAPSNVGNGATLSSRDSFNDRVSSSISRAKLKLIATPSMGPGAKTQEP